jgi:Flp pilus assembly protein TadD
LAAGVVVGLLSACVTTSESEPNSAQQKPAAPTESTQKMAPAKRTAMLARADSFLESDALEEALASYGEVLKYDSGDPDARIGLAEVSLAAGRKVQALAAFESLSEVAGVRAKAVQGRGLALLAIGKVKAAQIYLEEAVQADRNAWRSWNALGQIHDRARNFDDAWKSYEKAAEIRPDSAEIQNNMGVSMLMQRRYTEAGKLFREALARDPTLAVAETNYRLSLAWLGKYWQAVANLRKAQRQSMLNNAGVIAMQRGDLEEAETLLIQALDSSPSYYATAAENIERLKEHKRMKAEQLKKAKSTRPKTGS